MSPGRGDQRAVHRGSITRMPTHFGPSPGPRQKIDGTQWRRDEVTGSSRRIWVRTRTDPAALAALVGPAFEVREPNVTVSVQSLTDLWWLAGRGYNMLTVTVPVGYRGDTEHVRGDLILVMWENLADPIITGREELGFPKLWAEISDLQHSDRGARAEASWLGFRFAEVEVRDLVEGAPGTEPPPPNLVVKHVPRTGEPGVADAAYVTTSAPVPGAPLTPAAPPPPTRVWTGTGHASFVSATWPDLPTLVHVVNPLAALPMDEVVGAGLTEVTGLDLRVADQRIVAGPVAEPIGGPANMSQLT